jgi:NAD(P)-dependent dehydrogenase (short-subunit alcohol dehydrogenase family)
MSTNIGNSLDGQRALVTGAPSGIGRAVALQLARDRAEVLIHGRDATRGAETVEEITAAGGRASFVAADLTDAADVQWLASEVGDVDILINNAGISRFAPTAELDVDAFDKMFASNVRAPFLLVGALAPGMAARGHGSSRASGATEGPAGRPQLCRRTGGPQRQRRLQPHQVRRRRVQRIVAPGGHRPPRPHLGGRARRG